MSQPDADLTPEKKDEIAAWLKTLNQAEIAEVMQQALAWQEYLLAEQKRRYEGISFAAGGTSVSGG
jgi:hypothetical protein